MHDRRTQQKIAGPIVQPEIVEVLVRPVTHRTVAQRHHQAEQNIRRGQANGDEADIGGKINGRNHRLFGLRTDNQVIEKRPRKIRVSGKTLG